MMQEGQRKQPEQNGRYFAYNILKLFFNDDVCILIQMSLNFDWGSSCQ